MLGIMSGAVPIVLGMAFSFLGTALIARMVGPAVFGEYTFLLTWISVAALLSKAGHEWVLLKLIPGLIKIGKLGQIKFLLGKTFVAVMLRAGAALGILAGLATLHGHWSDPGIMVMGLALVLVLAFAELRRSWALAHRAIWLSDAPENIAKSIVMAGSVAVLLTWGVEVKPVTLLALNLCVTLITAIVAIFALIYIMLPGLLTTPSEPLPADVADTNDLARTMWLATALNISVRNLDLVIIGILSDATTTGLYAIATRIGLLSAAPVMVLDKIITPILSEAVEENNRKKIVSICQRFTWFASIGAVSVLVIFALFGSSLIKLIFGESYISSLSVVLIILLGNVGMAMAGPGNVIMALSGAHRQSLIITTIVAIINVILLLLLTYAYGATGTAAAVSVAISAKAWMSAIWVRLYMRVDITVAGLIKR